jgi:hypothetical protein
MKKLTKTKLWRADRQTGRQTDRHRQAGRQADRQQYRHADRQTDRQTDTVQTYKQQTDKTVFMNNAIIFLVRYLRTFI